MYVLSTPKEVVIKGLTDRQASVLTVLLNMDDIPYSLYGEDGMTRITIDAEYKNKLQCVTLEWQTISHQFREFFSS